MDEKFMLMAIEEAEAAAFVDEVPVGAVIVKNGEVLAKAHNRKETQQCSVYHAEIVAIMLACDKIGSWHLDDCDIYVTLEPCSMCAGAIINSRIKNVYFGAYDGKAGCCGTLYNLPVDKRFNHRPNVTGGILSDKCGGLLTDYFRGKRNARSIK